MYALTEPGREALLAWLRTPDDSLALKDGWLLRVWAVDHLRANEARALLAACERLHAERLATYRTLMRELARTHGALARTAHETLVGPYLCLQQGIWHEQMYVRWCRWARTRLAKRTRRRRPVDAVDLHALVARTAAR